MQFGLSHREIQTHGTQVKKKPSETVIHASFPVCRQLFPLCFRLSSACSSRGCLLLSSGLNFDEKDFPYHFFAYLLSSQPHCKPMRAGSTTFFNHHVPSTSTVPNTQEAFTKHIWNKYRHFCHGSHFIL